MISLKYWSEKPIRTVPPRHTVPWQDLIGQRIGRLKIEGWNHTPQNVKRVRNMVVRCACGLYGQVYAPSVYKKFTVTQCPRCDESQKNNAT